MLPEVPYLKNAVMNYIVDGDTFDFIVDCGFDINKKIRVRLIGTNGGIDAFELRDKDPAKRLLANDGRDFVARACPVGSPAVINTIQYKHDGFKRYLAIVTTAAIPSLGDALISAGLAVPWRASLGREQRAIRLALESYRQRQARFAALPQ